LRREGFAGKTVTLKVKYNDFVQITRSVTLPEVTDDGREVFRHCLRLLEKTEAGKRPIRLLGVSLSHLSAPGEKRQLSLFNNGIARQKNKAINYALDTIQEKFGDDAILPGTLLENRE
jgi:DNA polymerase-4